MLDALASLIGSERLPTHAPLRSGNRTVVVTTMTPLCGSSNRSSSWRQPLTQPLCVSERRMLEAVAPWSTPESQIRPSSSTTGASMVSMRSWVWAAEQLSTLSLTLPAEICSQDPSRTFPLRRKSPLCLRTVTLRELPCTRSSSSTVPSQAYTMPTPRT